MFSDLEPFMQWLKVTSPGEGEDKPPNGTVLQVNGYVKKSLRLVMVSLCDNMVGDMLKGKLVMVNDDNIILEKIFSCEGNKYSICAGWGVNHLMKAVNVIEMVNLLFSCVLIFIVL